VFLSSQLYAKFLQQKTESPVSAVVVNTYLFLRFDGICICHIAMPEPNISTCQDVGMWQIFVRWWWITWWWWMIVNRLLAYNTINFPTRSAHYTPNAYNYFLRKSWCLICSTEQMWCFFWARWFRLLWRLPGETVLEKRDPEWMEVKRRGRGNSWKHSA